MRDFIVKYNENDYRLMDLKDIRSLLKKEYKDYILEHYDVWNKEEMILNIEKLSMIDNYDIKTISIIMSSFGYHLYDLNDIKASLNVISDYLYYNTKQSDMFDRIEQVKNDISLLMNNFKDEV